jgi:hypothetical protein
MSRGGRVPPRRSATPTTGQRGTGACGGAAAEVGEMPRAKPAASPPALAGGRSRRAYCLERGMVRSGRGRRRRSGQPPPRRRPTLQHRATWRFTERSLFHALRALLGHLPLCPLRRDPSPGGGPVVGDGLRRAASWVMGCAERLGLSLTDVLRAVGDGTLPAVRTRPTVQLVDLWFSQATALRYLCEHQRPVRSARAPSWRDRLGHETPQEPSSPPDPFC